jgi:dTMP kinase
MTADKKLPGRLIAFEGLDGSGISTQIHLVQRWLAGLGCRVFYSEWDSSEMVKEATRRGKKQQLFTPTTFSLVYATDFADRYERQILPMLKGGFIVLCDRYVFTSFARDAVRGCDPAWLRELYGFAHIPDLTFYLDLPLHMAINRIFENRQQLNYFEAGMDLGLSQDIYESFRLFQGRVADRYLQMVNEFAFTVVDATRNIHEQQEILRASIAAAIDPADFRERASQ